MFQTYHTICCLLSYLVASYQYCNPHLHDQTILWSEDSGIWFQSRDKLQAPQAIKLQSTGNHGLEKQQMHKTASFVKPSHVILMVTDGNHQMKRVKPIRSWFDVTQPTQNSATIIAVFQCGGSEGLGESSTDGRWLFCVPYTLMWWLLHAWRSNRGSRLPPTLIIAVSLSIIPDLCQWRSSFGATSGPQPQANDAVVL